MENEIVIYQPDELPTRLEVRVEHENVWLNRQQISTLFDRDVKTVGKHIANVLKEELNGLSVVANFATTATDSKIYQVEYYNLDMIISVGYRVKSRRGIQFRVWANKILKDHLLKGYSMNQRLNRIENNVYSLMERVNGIDLQINANSLPRQGVFFDGQVFDAYSFVSQLIKQASKSIILIDNYVDESVLVLLGKKQAGVACTLFTKTVSEQLKLDVAKFNKQYPTLKAIEFGKAHDRFLIIDETEVYHVGASLKDLGQKWFAFTRLEQGSVTILQTIKDLL